jgi:outer membrane protein assembly factor BamE
MLKILISIVIAASLLGACTGLPSYRLDVRQGNVIEEAKLAQLQPGMTPRQVEFLLGSPQLQAAFVRGDRWDYVEYHRPGRGAASLRTVTVFFEEGLVQRVQDSGVQRLPGG